jgi:hypothetical protein
MATYDPRAVSDFAHERLTVIGSEAVDLVSVDDRSIRRGRTMTTTVIIGTLVGLVVGGAFMAMWAANRIEEEGARQFDRGFERGRWLSDISVARAIEDQDRSRRVGLLVASARPAVAPPARPPGQEPRPSLLVLP